MSKVLRIKQLLQKKSIIEIVKINMGVGETKFRKPLEN